MTEYAFVGVGSLAEAIVVGLSDGVDDPPSIALSPRGAERSSRLASRFSNVRVAASNQDAIDGAEVVVVAVLPSQADDVLSSLTFTADQHVVSAVAAVSVERLEQLTAPAYSVARTIPMPEVARRAGTTPAFPATAAATALFDRLGSALAVLDETTFTAMSVATATVAAHFHYVSTIADWLAEQGLDQADAEDFVAGVFQPLDLDPTHGLSTLASAHATPGGFNEGFDRALTEAGVFDTMRAALDANLRRTQGGS